MCVCAAVWWAAFGCMPDKIGVQLVIQIYVCVCGTPILGEGFIAYYNNKHGNYEGGQKKLVTRYLSHCVEEE